MTQFFRDQGGQLHQFPDDATPDEMAKAVEGAGAKPPAAAGPPTSVARVAGFAGKGFNDSAAEAIGALPELVAGGVRKLTGVSLAPSGYYPAAIKSGLDWLGVGGPQGAPQGPLERGAYGAGRGVADAASVVLPAAAVARTARAGSLLARIGEALAAQPVTQAIAGAAGGAVGEATDSPYLGLLASLAVPVGASGIRRIISPVVNRLTPEQARLAAVAAHEGIQLTPGQATGSRPLQTAESVLGTLPLSSGMAQRTQQAQREAFNAAVLQRAGITSNVATPDVIDAAHVRLGNEFERLAASTTVAMDPQFVTDLRNTLTDYNRKLPVAQRQIFHGYINDILNYTATPGGMPGTQYQVTRSDLGRLSKSLRGNDPVLAQAMDGLQSALDDAAGRNIPPALQDAWQTARRQYGNLRIIDRAMAIPSAGAAAGDISPAQIWGGLKQQRGDAGMARGRGELNDLARVGQAFIKPQIPNSGTPERSIMTKILTGGLPLGGAMLGAGNPSAAAAGAAIGTAGLGIAPAVQAFMNSGPGRAYLTNQVATGLGPRTDAALLAAILAGRGKNQATGLAFGR